MCGGGGGGRVKRTISIVNALQKLKRGPKEGRERQGKKLAYIRTLFL